MFALHRNVSRLPRENLVRACRVSAEVMDVLSVEVSWRDPFEKVAVHAAVDCRVASLIRHGETNEDVLKTKVLATVLHPFTGCRDARPLASRAMKFSVKLT